MRRVVAPRTEADKRVVLILLIEVNALHPCLPPLGGFLGQCSDVRAKRTEKKNAAAAHSGYFK